MLGKKNDWKTAFLEYGACLRMYGKADANSSDQYFPLNETVSQQPAFLGILAAMSLASSTPWVRVCE